MIHGKNSEGNEKLPYTFCILVMINGISRSALLPCGKNLALLKRTLRTQSPLRAHRFARDGLCSLMCILQPEFFALVIILAVQNSR